jgi:hypothetical protein
VCGAAERVALRALAARLVRAAAERLVLGALDVAADDARARARRRLGALNAGSCRHAGRGRASRQRSHGAGRDKRDGIGQWG